MDYSAPNIENRDEEEFEHIDNLDNSFDFDQDQFKNFLKSLYLARKLMGLEYSNHTMSKMRQPCNQ
ncbi:35328_t:CDS:2 [Racocetra persica]|uniref:35328_t:CDS:1 n=1 Tax=Racocetra persica TaxID=160502 RepID=A0ACA9LC96_9GLOM|nr:35328_t:CDS:2 [Racocetra persica]